MRMVLPFFGLSSGPPQIRNLWFPGTIGTVGCARRPGAQTRTAPAKPPVLGPFLLGMALPPARPADPDFGRDNRGNADPAEDAFAVRQRRAARCLRPAG